MASITGIELKPDSCVLAGLRETRSGADVFALHAIAPADWPGQDVGVAALLRAARTGKRMPRRARVVVWGMPDHGSAEDPATLALLGPLTSAGFRIQSVMTPPQALAALASSRPRQIGSGAVAWLALNMHGAAIAIVQGSELLYSRTFDWLYTAGVAGASAQLLQRYTLVAHLAPELRHGIAHVRASHGVAVETAVTCGDLPDLRSLTMPLIEELDIEVETLDSTDGLRPIGRAKEERFAELVPAMRLALATGLVPVMRARKQAVPRRWIPAAAVLVLVAAGVGYVYWSAPDQTSTQSVSVRPTTPVPGSAVRQGAAKTQPSTAAVPVTAPGPTAAIRGPATGPTAAVPGPATGPTAAVPGPATGPTAAEAPLPRVQPSNPTVAADRATALSAPQPSSDRVARALPPAAQPLAPQAASPPTVATKPSSPTRSPAAPAMTAMKTMTANPGPEQLKRPPTDNQEARLSPVPPPTPQPQRAPAAAPSGEVVLGSRVQAPRESFQPLLQALREPLPRVDSILIDRDRRLTMIDGAILGVGDMIGHRTVAQIDRVAVVLREPSGLEIRVPLRGSGAR